MWIWWCIGALVLTSLSLVFAKCGLRNADSEVATFIRTLIVAVCYWGIIYFNGTISGILNLGIREVLYLLLTGITLGLGWIFFFKALKKGDLSKVAATDELVVVMLALLSYLTFGETPSGILETVALAVIIFGVYLILKRGKVGFWELIVSIIVIFSLLLGYYYFGKTYPLVIKIIYIGIVLALIIYLIVKALKIKGGSFILFSLLSVFFTALTAILSRIGLSEVNEDLALALRTLVILLLLIVVILIGKKWGKLNGIKGEGLLFIILSGVFAGAMWICSTTALSLNGGVVPRAILESSLVLTTLMAAAFLKEKLTVRSVLGMLFITAATITLVVI
jgi:transporter family protein